ncbi:hypothetical protein [Myroides odoratus]|uniref:Uncharacterized protein n=1 Tax=Myroides odoratus TaxID=256 RepID=A0A9Q6Z7H6_MYROD|nr:hypothetical protein [Myroides odoratus]QQU01777.1 hypothetical protein I6I88_08565 [Myroides odoratus]WQD55938.1 hypothetical protein U0010_10415 [Myroides odoratus]
MLKSNLGFSQEPKRLSKENGDIQENSSLYLKEIEKSKKDILEKFMQDFSTVTID